MTENPEQMDWEPYNENSPFLNRFYVDPHLFIHLQQGLQEAFENDEPFIYDVDGPYFQAKKLDDRIIAELSSPQNAGTSQTADQVNSLLAQGWIAPNEECPNFHREYSIDKSLEEIANQGAIGLISGFSHTD